MKNIFYKIVILAFLLNGCAKTASESATEASLHQVAVIEQQIKKECPTAKIDAQITALQANIKTQLLTCESEKATLRERNNLLLAILIGLISVIIALNWFKIKKRLV